MKRFSSPWLKALSGLFINFSAAAFITAFAGVTVSTPKTIGEFLLLTFHLGVGILFLLLTAKLEEKLEK